MPHTDQEAREKTWKETLTGQINKVNPHPPTDPHNPIELIPLPPATPLTDSLTY